MREKRIETGSYEELTREEAQLLRKLENSKFLTETKLELEKRGIFGGRLTMTTYRNTYGEDSRYVHYWDRDGAWITEKWNDGQGQYVHPTNGGPATEAWSIECSIKGDARRKAEAERRA